MPTPNFRLVIDQVSAALNAASLQNRVTASNIANRDSEGFVRMRLSFDRAMLDAATPFAGSTGTRDAVRSVLPHVVADERSASLEEDLMTLSKNTLHYQALVKSLSRYLSIASAIANAGRI
jgi:flagellar basal-body rod protein FlgB